MRTSSAKAKGRRCCAEAKEAILKAFPGILTDDDIQVTPSGVTGEDLWLSTLARAVLPLAIECKNQEAMNIWKSLDQAEYHANKRIHSIATLIFKRNRSKLYVAMGLEDFLKLYTRGSDQRVIEHRKEESHEIQS
jgi:hypothetical protein